MKLLLLMVLSQMKRQKTRLFFILLAIAASSCLIVWTMGGYRSLFTETVSEESDTMGGYHLRVQLDDLSKARGDAMRGAGGGFSGPFTRRTPTKQTDTKKQVDTKKPAGPPVTSDSDRSTKPRRSKRPESPAIPESFIEQLQNDSNVIACDAFGTLRVFCYYEQEKPAFSPQVSPSQEPLLSDNIHADEVHADNNYADVPDGIDPELHRRGLAAYREVMGTPMSFGRELTATTAVTAPFELEEGRWLRQDEEACDAVLTAGEAKKRLLRPGDSMLLITKTKEYQFQVVGILDDGEGDGIYLPWDMAARILDSPPPIRELGLKLRTDPEAFRARWEPQLQQTGPALQLNFLTKDDMIQRKKAEMERQGDLFRYQAISGTLLAVLASIFIIFTALNMSVHERKRQIAFYRMVGLTRGQIGLSVLVESLLLSLPGWLTGVLAGWLLLYVSTGRTVVLNGRMLLFSLVCSVLGALIAAFYPMMKSIRVRPLDALTTPAEDGMFLTARSRHRPVWTLLMTLTGLLFLAMDIYLVGFLPVATETRALLHSGLGMLLLVLGVFLLIPALVLLTETVALPVLCRILRLDSRLVRSELSGNPGRTLAVTTILSVGGGLFISMQIWGYSMLGPFLPGRSMPERFAAFLPVGLEPEFATELQTMPGIKSNEFLPIAVEQAAFAPGSIPSNEGGMGASFANVVFFGAEPEQAFATSRPMVSMRYLQGNRNEAVTAMKQGRGVVITDSISVDYGLNYGDTLRVVHPRDDSKILEYPVVGVVSFPGWQWLSKTGGVRRNFGRSGGIVFANSAVIIADYQLDRCGYFWFNSDGSVSSSEMEQSLDRLARQNLAVIRQKAGDTSDPTGQAAWVKLSTRESLYDSVSDRADSVIWGMSKMPLMTLVITSIAIVAAITNSVRARRRTFGILRSVGIDRGVIVRMILLEAILIGIVATMTSFLFGFLAASGALKLGQSMFGTVNPPLILPWSGLAFGFALTLILCLAAALYPAIVTGYRDPLVLLQEKE